MQIGRVTARAQYELVGDDYAYDPSPLLHETSRLDELLVCLHDRYIVGEIENVVISVGETRLPGDVVHEIFSAMAIVEKR